MSLVGSDWAVWLRRPATYSLAALFVCIVYLYGFNGNTEYVGTQGHSAIRWMASRWSGQVAADMSHGWLIPLVSMYALWWRRKAIEEADTGADWRGIFLVMLALGLYWVGVRGQQTRLTLLSLVLLLWSIPFAFWGSAVARQLIFPVGYLIFCIPLSFLDSMTFPLRLFASAVSAEILNGLGIATIRTGTALHSAVAGGFSFEVADPCSGLRSVLAMTALTAAYAHFIQKGFIRQWLLFLSAFPLAVAGNIVRIVTIGVIAQLFGQEQATGFYHDYSGYVFFLAATGLMLATASFLNRDWRFFWATVLSKLHAVPRS
jgi:exosortase